MGFMAFMDVGACGQVCTCEASTTVLNPTDVLGVVDLDCAREFSFRLRRSLT